MKKPEKGIKFLFKKKEFLPQNSFSLVSLFLKLTIGLFLVVSLAGIVFASSFFIPALQGINKTTTTPLARQVDKSVLAASAQKLLGKISFNIPAFFNDTVTFEKATTFNGPATFNNDIHIVNHDLDLGTGKLTAANVVYGITAGQGITVTGGQTPTIANTGVLSVQGQTGDVALLAGT